MNVITRLAAMDREEARFRLLCGARKLAGRIQYAVTPPRWDRSAILRVLDPDAASLVARAWDAAKKQDYHSAHRALAEHFRTRASRWPLQAGRRHGLSDEIRQRFPDAARHARDAADRILDGRHDLLGYVDVPVGNPPDWHRDAVHDRTVPRDHWTAVSYLDPLFGDHKIIWETSRHQYWLALGRAYWLTGDRRYRTVFIAHLEDWLQSNPPLTGANWASMLELAFRAMSWTWAVEFFSASDADADADETPWLLDLLIALDRQLAHVAQNLSTYFSPNTHLSGEALALYVVSLAFPELRRSRTRVSTGRSMLLAEAKNQVRADGGHAELSSHYHRYSTDFYLLATMLARASGDGAVGPLEDAARRQAAYLRTIADEQGRLPRIGDDDGGQLFKFGGTATSDASATLSVAAALFNDRALAVRPPSEEVYWILGRRPEVAISVSQPASWPSRFLPDSGYFVSRSADGGHLVFDAGPHGFLNGGHAHADALSVLLSVGGEPLLVDPGAATYTMDPALRDLFRSSRMHNTLTLDGREHAEPHGPFHWLSRADARFLVARTTADGDYAVGTHDAYGKGRHMRAVLTLPDSGWLIVDRIVTDAAAEADTWWHLHPAWRAVVRDGTVALRHASGRHLALATTADDITVIDDPQIASVSFEYGRVQPSTTVRARRHAAGSFYIATFVASSSAESDGLAIVEVPAETTADERWRGCAFAIHAGGVDRRVQLAFPSDPEAQPPADEWPQPCITRSPRHQMAAATHQ